MKCIACGKDGAHERHCCDDKPRFCEGCFDKHHIKVHDPKNRCPDCAVEPGNVHDGGCDVERCSVCKGQWISCGHDNHDPEQSKWTGLWPGVAECRELGFWCIERRDARHPIGGCFWPCAADYPGAREDLNRLACFNALGHDKYIGSPILGTVTT